MRYDVMNEHYTEIRLFGKPALFNDMRLDQETVPNYPEKNLTVRYVRIRQMTI